MHAAQLDDLPEAEGLVQHEVLDVEVAGDDVLRGVVRVHTRDQLGQILGKYMMHVNDVRLAEYRGSHSPKDTALFVKIEQSRLWRTLIELLGSEATADLQVLMETNIPHNGSAASEP